MPRRISVLLNAFRDHRLLQCSVAKRIARPEKMRKCKVKVGRRMQHPSYAWNVLGAVYGKVKAGFHTLAVPGCGGSYA